MGSVLISSGVVGFDRASMLQFLAVPGTAVYLDLLFSATLQRTTAILDICPHGNIGAQHHLLDYNDFTLHLPEHQR